MHDNIQVLIPTKERQSTQPANLLANIAEYRENVHDIYIAIEDPDMPGTITLRTYGCKNKRPAQRIQLSIYPLSRLAFTRKLDYTRRLYLVAETSNPSSSVAVMIPTSSS
jgi:hypothetical protein